MALHYNPKHQEMPGNPSSYDLGIVIVKVSPNRVRIAPTMRARTKPTLQLPCLIRFIVPSWNSTLTMSREHSLISPLWDSTANIMRNNMTHKVEDCALRAGITLITSLLQGWHALEVLWFVMSCRLLCRLAAC